MGDAKARRSIGSHTIFHQIAVDAALKYDVRPKFDSKLEQKSLSKPIAAVSGEYLASALQIEAVDSLRAQIIIGKVVKTRIIDTSVDYKAPALDVGYGPGDNTVCGYSWNTDSVKIQDSWTP